VAVKTVKKTSGATREDLLKEAAVMALFNHANVLGLLGLVSIPRSMPAMLILPLMVNGTLDKFLMRHSRQSLSVVAQLTLANDVARGLEYLSSYRFIHRDVAARNVLLDARLNCKISDFGMSQVLADDGKQYIRLQEELPVRWSAVEMLVDKKFSAESDIWAFGVLVWEIFSFGQMPYEELGGLAEYADFVKRGGKLAMPEACPSDVYNSLLLFC